jgi:hypothetical protein
MTVRRPIPHSTAPEVSKPEIRPGAFEQAIYTWSKVNLNGRKGQGFGAVSAGLRSSGLWLSSLNFDRFALLDDGLSHASQAYLGWQSQIVTGAFHASGVNVVYRKIASAGVDSGSRNRWLVHILVGRSDELDISTVVDNDPHWLEADDCPLNELPALLPLYSAEFTRRRVTLLDGKVEALAEDLLERLRTTPQRWYLGREAPLSPATLIDALLVAVPTPLWANIELDWFVGALGPVAKIGIHHAVPSATRDSRASRAGLDDSTLHRSVDNLWAELPLEDRSWATFVSTFAQRKRRGAPLKQLDARKPLAADVLSPVTERLAEAIAAAIGDTSWNYDLVLNDPRTQRALGAMAKLEPPNGGWLSVLDGDQLHVLLSGIERSSTFARAVRLLDGDPRPSTSRLASAWRSTSLAPLGFALVERDPGRFLPGRWALPRSIDPNELRKLLEQLLRRGLPGPGGERISRLLNGGFSSTPTARHSLVEALAALNVNERHLFETILPAADLPPSVLLNFMRDDVDATGRWLGLSEPYVEALRRGLTRRRRRGLNSFRPLFRGDDEETQ